jgi:hypothetical protein
VDHQENRQSQTDSEMNPTTPDTQFFVPRIVKSVAGDGQNSEHAEENRTVRPIASLPKL